MPSQRRSNPSSLQRQGKPRSAVSRRVQTRRPIESPDGGTEIVTFASGPRGVTRTTERRTAIPTGGSQFETTTEQSLYGNRARRNANLRSFSPVRAGEKTTAGVGLLEAEFIGAELIVLIELFTNEGSYGDKIMAAMKRGMLTAILFFVLAMVASIGPNASKVSKAIGALVIVSLFLTAPVEGMLTTLDNFFKGDWQGSSESGPVSSTNASNSSSGSATTPGNTFASLPANIQKELEGEPVFEQYSGIFGGAEKAYEFLKSAGSGVLGFLGL